MQFTKEQIEYIEDGVINMLHPAHGLLDRALDRKKIYYSDVKMARDSIEKVAKWIRDLRLKNTIERRKLT